MIACVFELLVVVGCRRCGAPNGLSLLQFVLSCSVGALASGFVSCFGECTSSVSEMLSNFVSACRNREVFPLPLLSVPVLQNPAISRSCKQSVGRDNQTTIRANDAIEILNDMFSVSCNDSVQQARNSFI